MKKHKLTVRPESAESSGERRKASPAAALNSAPAAAFLCAQQMSPTDDTHRSEISVRLCQGQHRKTREAFEHCPCDTLCLNIKPSVRSRRKERIKIFIYRLLSLQPGLSVANIEQALTRDELSLKLRVQLGSRPDPVSFMLKVTKLRWTA